MTEVSFGEWLKRQRMGRGLTREQLAHQIGCAVVTLRKIESEERRPSAQIVECLAEIFEIPQDQNTAFLRFARGDWRSAPTGVTEDFPWLAAPTGEQAAGKSSQPGIHLATFLFTDIEGSTRLWDQVPEKMKFALQRHHAILEEAIISNGGAVFQIVGDAFCAAFPTVQSAILSAVKAQRELHQEPWDLPFPIRVRMGIHTGEAERSANASILGGYASNQTLNRVARILSAAHGGQVLLSLATTDLVKDALSPDTELRDLGEHHLRNLTHPEHLFQLNISGLPGEFPPLNTLTHRNNLPIQVTRFIGREKEQAEIIGLLTKNRLVSLTGPGGIGKTRLSLQLGYKLLDDFTHGVWFVELAPILDPLLVPRTTAIAIGLRDEPQRPVIDMLCDYLHDKQMLIILDNCEHLIEACASLADQLLHATPELHILASSREVLGIPGEVNYRVPSLGLPDVEHLPQVESLGQYEAVSLFIDRAKSAAPSFILTTENAPALAQVCRRLDGIPLAIELAAAKTHVLSVEQIAKRLDDRFHLLASGNRIALERHQTLRSAIDWSYNLLSPPEQILFRRASVFIGGWTLEAAESVCAHEWGYKDDVLNLMEQLVNKSLVIVEEADRESHYRMLETIRQYAHEKLGDFGESNLMRDCHLEYFLNLAETAAPHLIRVEQLEWLAQLDADYENLRAALEWALSKNSSEPSLRLCAALGRYWYFRTFWLEGSQWLQRALSKTNYALTPTEKVALVKALQADAELADQMDDLERMKSSVEKYFTLAQDISDKREITIARFEMGNVLYRQGNYEKALPMLEQSYDEFQAVNDPFWQSYAYHWLTELLDSEEKVTFSEKLKRMEACLKLARLAGERLNLAELLNEYSEMLFSQNQLEEAINCAKEADHLYKEISPNLNLTSYTFAELAWLRDDYKEAERYYLEMEERFSLIGERNSRAHIIQRLGQLAMEQGHLDQAQTYFEEALATAREVSGNSYIASRLWALGITYYLRDKRDLCVLCWREAIPILRVLKKISAVGRYILLLTVKYTDVLDLKIGARLLGAVNFSQHERPITPLVMLNYNRAITQVRGKLGDQAFELAFAEGQKTSLYEALELALKAVESL